MPCSERMKAMNKIFDELLNIAIQTIIATAFILICSLIIIGIGVLFGIL